MDILIKGATVVTQDKTRSVKKADILVSDGRIASVGKSMGEKADERIDASGMVAMPGMFNMHTHAAMTLFRGMGEDLPLRRWLEEKIWPMEAKQTEEDAYVAAKLAFAEMIRSGATCFNEMCLLGAKEIGRAANEVGIRGHVTQGLFDLLPGRTTEGELEVMRKTAYPQDGLVSFGIGPHAPYTCTEELLRESKKFAKRKKMRLHLHVSETRREVFEILDRRKKYPYEYLDSLGLLDSATLLAHGTWVTKREITLAGKKGATVLNCPTSNLKLATGGICPLPEYDEAGANVCLGTDSVASNNALSMFEAMKMAALLQKHRYWKPDALRTQRIVDFATLNGAKALGMDAGSIEEGRLADITLLKQGLNTTPMNDVVSNLVFSACPRNVDTVIIDGKPVLLRGEFTTINEEKLMKEAGQQAEKMKKRK